MRNRRNPTRLQPHGRPHQKLPKPSPYEPRTGDEQPFPVVVNAPVRLLGLSDTVIQA